MGENATPTDGPNSRKRWPLLAGAGVAIVVVAVVAFGYFGVHTLFTDDVVDEAGPAFDSGATVTTTTAPAEEDTAAPDEAPGTTTTSTAPSDTEAETEVVVAASGMFSGVGRYSGAGTATILTDGVQRFVRFEDDFSTDNGPDLFVFLGTGSGDYGDPAQYIDLGVLRGNIGAQNYEIPAVHPVTGEPIDLSVFNHVAVWCKRFDSTFTIAPLA